VAPVTPHDAKGMMLSAIRDPNPVIFLEAGALYGTKGEVPEGEYTVPFGEARIAREGNDVTLIAYGRQVNLLLRVAERLANEEKIDAEVIDLRSIRPFDTETIVASVRKTNRAVVVQEQWRWFSVASEVAALIQEQAFDDLDAPVVRVSGAEAPAPYARNLELAAFPNENDVIDAVRRVTYREN
jgi:pyruvate dehydrogenase E1 component beta subunit